MLHQQNRDIDEFLRSNGSISRTNYLRILILASLDIILTLPLGIVNFTLVALNIRADTGLYFWPGWDEVHTNWSPISVSHSELVATGPVYYVRTYLVPWISPVLAFAIFSLFGCTSEARSSYWRVLSVLAGWFGWRLAPRREVRSSLGAIEFGEHPEDIHAELEATCAFDPAYPHSHN